MLDLTLGSRFDPSQNALPRHSQQPSDPNNGLFGPTSHLPPYPTYPLALGGSYHGMGGPAGATPQADVLLAVGTRFSRQMAGGTRPNASQLLVHIDADAEVFGRNFPAKVAIAADAKMALSDLLDEIRERVQRRDGRSRRSPKFVKIASSRSRSSLLCSAKSSPRSRRLWTRTPSW